MRTCSKNKCIEGSKRSFGIVSFDLGYTTCDHCYANNNSRKTQRKGYECEYNSGIYSIIDTKNNDEVVYVGKSTSLSYRWYVHLGGVRNGAKQFLNRPASYLERKRYKFVPLMEINDNPIMMKLKEIAYIEKYNPKFNKLHTNG